MKRIYQIPIVALFTLSLNTACKKYFEIPLPVDQVSGPGAFANDNSTAAVLNNILGEITSSGSLSGTSGFPLRSGLYTDELQNAATFTDYIAYYTNNVQSAQTGPVWSDLYRELYAINLAVEGVRKTSPQVLTKKDQWLGEAIFLRALMHFYLVNLYGDVPVVTTSDFRNNNELARSPSTTVYKQIITDLKEAQSLLTPDYRNAAGNTTTDRARPNKHAATALLARVYLYTGDWANAEAQSQTIIDDQVNYLLPPPAQSFLSNSKETIWGLAPAVPANFVRDAAAYIITDGKPPIEVSVPAHLSASLLNEFEAGDLRFANWVGVSNVPANGNTPAASYYFANKYKVRTTSTTATEYLVVLRLAEQYLIRAEARARQNNLAGAKTDLDAVRARASLTGTTAATMNEMLDAILQERRVELFTEWGHRLLDLRRMGKLDAVMTVEAPLKSASWTTFKQWWPIPTIDIFNNPNLTQTPGYQ